MGAEQYVGRLVDMAAFRGMFPSAREQLLAQELVTTQDGGALLAGIEKLGQNVLMLLFLEKGSKKYDPEAGCQFMIDAQQGFWRTPADVTQSFNLSRTDIRRQIQLKETPDDPPDEIYESLTLDGVTLSGDKVTIRATLVSQAGSNYKFLTPITVAII